MKRRIAHGVGVAALLALAACAYLGGAPASAEQSGRGGVVVSFDAALTPKTLPRGRLAPISIRLSGRVRGGETPPRLRRVELAFGARGGLETRGLPICPRARLRNATHRQALARCRAAVVGRGAILTEVPLNPTEPVRARAALLAFNAKSRGRPAVWVHAYSASPAVSFVLPFRLSRPRSGAYGVALSAHVGRALGRWPRLRAFQLTLGRRYRRQGSFHSYLNGRCPLPPRLRSLSVPLARATYHFAPRPTLSTTILRACRAAD